MEGPVEIDLRAREAESSPEVIPGIILAAGASSRMGRPKALLSWNGETFLARLQRVLGSVCQPVVTVLGYHYDSVRPEVQGDVAVNCDPSRGQLSSLQTGLRAISYEKGFAFVPVDCPAVSAETVATLAELFSHGEAELVIPRYNGERGHPVCASATVAQQLLLLPPTGSAKDVIRSLRDKTTFVDLADPGVLSDIDDPAAYAALTGRAL